MVLKFRDNTLAMAPKKWDAELLRQYSQTENVRFTSKWSQKTEENKEESDTKIDKSKNTEISLGNAQRRNQRTS